MEVNIYPDYNKMSAETADLMVKSLLQNPKLVLVLASGSTPIKTYELFVEELISRNIDSSQMTIIGLDEWVGIDHENTGSCFAFFEKYFLSKLSLLPSQYYFFNGMASDLSLECRQMDEYIRSRGGIDLMIVGIGTNGHIGFNEPGISADKYSHVTRLTETTKINGQKYFQQKTELDRGITLGLQYLIEAKQVILVANGEHKSQIIADMMHFAPVRNIPASLLKQHDNAMLMLDKQAASQL